MPLTTPAPNSAPALLAVNNLNIRFSAPSGWIQAVSGLSFQVGAGKIVALVGESGSGKSVTARSLVGLAGDKAHITADSLTLSLQGQPPVSLLHHDERRWQTLRGRDIGFILQDALTSLDPLRRIGDEVAEALQTHRKLSPAARKTRVLELLASVGIPDPENRATMYAHELSGGLRQRALIASALAAGPQLLIADEPTTALDASVQRQILRLFRSLADNGHGILLITHDLSVVADIADDVVVMQHGLQRESGPARQILSAPTHPYTRQLLASVPSGHTRGRWLTGDDPLSQHNTRWAPDKPQETRTQGPSSLLAASDLAVTFRTASGRHIQAVSEVSLTLARGETLGIVGESGSGKTTLGKMLLGLQTPDTGQVTLLGETWSPASERVRRPRRRVIQTIVQDPLGSFNPHYTVGEILRQPLRLAGVTQPQAQAEQCRVLLALTGLSSDYLDRRPSRLSGGQRQRVSIAQALASHPDILICDEPVSALDVTTQAQVLDLLVSLQKRLGLSMVFISHDLSVIRHISHRIAVMKAGKIVEQGDAEQIFSTPAHDYTRALISAVF